MSNTWYPTSHAALPPFHTTFVLECNNNAATLASVLIAGVLTQITTNKNTVTTAINALSQASNYASEVSAWAFIILEGPHGTGLPAAPAQPAAITTGLGAMAAIEDYTRRLVAQIKAHPNYTIAMGEAMGIEPGTASTGTPAVRPTALGGGHVQVDITKAGYDVVALDKRVNGGPWAPLAVVTTSPYFDTAGPLAPGVTQVNEYKAQGVVNNLRVGPESAPASIATTP